MNNVARDPLFEALFTVGETATVSSAEDGRGFGLAGLALPADLTSTTIGLQISVDDGDTWLDVYDSTGALLSFTVAPGIYVALPIYALPGIPGQVRLTLGSAEADAREILAYFRKLS